jgi:achilleol B synthase
MQNEDGGWGTHVWGPSNMLGSCLNYVALRLLGEMLHNDNDALTKGHAWILSHGSATAVPQWGKIFLSVCIIRNRTRQMIFLYNNQN